MEKQYGLIDPKANKAAAGKAGLTKHAAFDSSDSDSDGKDAKKSVNLELGDAQKRQARAAQQKALAEDPTVYQYDELYDEMDSKRKEAKVDKSKEERKPKYIGKLLETADKRKKEQERRIERQVQKEREAEGEKFQDKESFVTSAYRAKLEEMKKAEEEEKREEYLESIGDVTKQKDLGGFYRHIYSQKMGEGGEKKKEEEEEEKVKEEKPDPEDESKKGGSDDEERARREALKSKDAAGSSKSRRYRKRRSDEGEEDEKNDSSKKVHLQSNLDADSDFSIDSKSDGSSSDESAGDEGGKRKKKRASSAEKSEPKQDKPEEDRQSANGGVENGAKVKEEKDVEADSGDAVKSEKKEKKEEKKKEPKIDIWKKRTVGEVFEAAQQRYYERKAARESG